MKKDHRAAAEGMLDLFGFDDYDNPAAHARALAIAIRISEALDALTAKA